MDNQTKTAFEKLESTDREEQYEAYQNIIKATGEKVDWAYEVWNELIEGLTDKDNHNRSRAAQFLAHLAISDPGQRILRDFSKVWNVTYDEKFVTARHSLQAIWRVGLAGEQQRKLVMEHMIDRFKNSMDEKNYTLLRSDILQNMRNLYDHLEDEQIKETALELIETVEDEKYKKKYAKIWK